MAMRRRPNARNPDNGGLVALFPLVMVFSALGLLGFGASMAQAPSRVAQSGATQTAAVATSHGRTAGAAEDAAAAAIVAISIARVAPPLPEDALKASKPVAPDRRTGAQAKKADAGAGPAGGAQADARARAQNAPDAPRQSSYSIAPPPSRQSATEPRRPAPDGVLARIGSYAPSPQRIANAVTASVAKLASYIPGL